MYLYKVVAMYRWAYRFTDVSEAEAEACTHSRGPGGDFDGGMHRVMDRDEENARI